MAFFYLRASYIKASSGKSAVASSAYQSGDTLFNERTGMTFSYRNKEEVIFSEILLPTNAPDTYKDRATLWNAVEAKENKSNSRYARQFVIALPKEWTREERIEHSREFVQKLVDRGMAADWSYHEKDQNPHIHIMTTIRGFNPDGSWANQEKKIFALDENGNRIPEVDKKTGEQKVRVRTRNGHTTTEKLWKRITVQKSEWNGKKFLRDVRREWADTCNRYLDADNQITHLSYAERGLNRVALLHEGPEARAAMKRGVVFDVVKENQERRRLNEQLAKLEQFIAEARKILQELKNRLEKWRKQNDEKRSKRTIEFGRGNGSSGTGLSETFTGNHDRIGRTDSFQRLKEESEKLEKRSKKIHRRR